ncbi:MAG: hypothetical protein AAGF12_15600 [Myxococcota bacterium]
MPQYHLPRLDCPPPVPSDAQHTQEWRLPAASEVSGFVEYCDSVTERRFPNPPSPRPHTGLGERIRDAYRLIRTEPPTVRRIDCVALGAMCAVLGALVVLIATF